MVFIAVATAYCREISGKVVGENDVPLDYVNVVLYRDSSYITGAVTDSAGIFKVNTEPTVILPHAYRLSATRHYQCRFRQQAISV